jgi:hypothetical protein
MINIPAPRDNVTTRFGYDGVYCQKEIVLLAKDGVTQLDAVYEQENLKFTTDGLFYFYFRVV